MNKQNKILNHYRNTILDQTGIDVKLPGRIRDKTDLVKIFCHHAKKNNHTISYQTIGEFLNRDHSTIIHSCNSYISLYTTDKDFKDKAEFFITRFCAIDGHSRNEANKDELLALIELAPEVTRGEWLEMIKNTPLIKKALDVNVNYETVTND
tara:strand:+ start:945 stop:1400 length:456 start_codon:yes stop_codon:yes gene_type:complete